ncbi:MAG: hypothetical protein U5L00_09515 [Desulfovermiculus sp.]|nr:hypothetical protein [Desulfovermiculus sp.]
MSKTVFSFHFLPEQDRLGLTFSGEEAVPAVLLTRRLVKMLGGYLRRYVEKHTSLPESVTAEDKDDIFQFMHMSELESNPPSWDSGRNKQEKTQELAKAKLTTKIDIQYSERSVKLKFFNQKTHLMSMSLGWKEIHSFLYSLAEMSLRADWGLEGVFEWSGRAEVVPEGRGQ